MLAFVVCAVLALVRAEPPPDKKFGKYIGQLSTLAYDVSGDVYAVDGKTLFIKDFTYTGGGPAGFFWIGPINSRGSNGPTDDGLVVPDENGSTKPLGRYHKKDITLTIPGNRSVSDLEFFSIWCTDFSVDFGHVTIPRGFRHPEPLTVPGFPTFEHEVTSGPITIVDAQTFLIPDFSYDGQAPAAYFWVGKGQTPSPTGFPIPDENGSNKAFTHPYNKKTIVLSLPGDLTVYDIDYLSVWCEDFRVNFGHINIPKDLNVPPSLRMLGVRPETSRDRRPSQTVPVHSRPVLSGQEGLRPTTFRPKINPQSLPIHSQSSLRGAQFFPNYPGQQLASLRRTQQFLDPASYFLDQQSNSRYFRSPSYLQNYRTNLNKINNQSPSYRQQSQLYNNDLKNQFPNHQQNSQLNVNNVNKQSPSYQHNNRANVDNLSNQSPSNQHEFQLHDSNLKNQFPSYQQNSQFNVNNANKQSPSYQHNNRVNVDNLSNQSPNNQHESQLHDSNLKNQLPSYQQNSRFNVNNANKQSPSYQHNNRVNVENLSNQAPSYQQENRENFNYLSNQAPSYQQENRDNVNYLSNQSPSYQQNYRENVNYLSNQSPSYQQENRENVNYPSKKSPSYVQNSQSSINNPSSQNYLTYPQGQFIPSNFGQQLLAQTSRPPLSSNNIQQAFPIDQYNFVNRPEVRYPTKNGYQINSPALQASLRFF